jgi:integrase
MAEVVKRGDGYVIRVSLGYDAKHRRLRKNFSWKPDTGMTPKQIEKELAKKVRHYEEMVENGLAIEGNLKFEAFADKWIREYAEMQLAPKTVYEYKKQLVRINKAIGHVRLDRIRPSQLIEFYNNLAEDGIRSDIKYKPNESAGNNSDVKIAEKIKSLGLNTTQVAIMSDLGPSTILSACQGKNINSASAKAIAKALEIKLSDYFTPVESKGALSGNSILHYHRLVSSILSTAVDWQIIPANPADRVKAPRTEKMESRYLDEVQAKHVIELLQDEPEQFRSMITLLIFTGIRRGELSGIKWSDIDFENKLLHIRRAVQYIPGRGIFEKLPKNKSSIRTIRLASVVVRLLLEQRNIQTTEMKACGEQWQDHDLVFTRWNGTYFNPDDLTSWFSDFVKRYNLCKVTPHSLRHTNATLMIAGGTDLRTISKRLGHAQTSTTSNIYAHAIMSADEAATETLENILDPIKPLIQPRKIDGQK